MNLVRIGYQYVRAPDNLDGAFVKRLGRPRSFRTLAAAAAFSTRAWGRWVPEPAERDRRDNAAFGSIESMT